VHNEHHSAHGGALFGWAALIRILESGSMPTPCSLGLCERVVDAVESGASRREAADCFDVSPSSAIKWMQRRQATGSIAAKPGGGSVSPLEAHAAFSALTNGPIVLRIGMGNALPPNGIRYSS
jgi:hypothetical protein